MQCIRHTSLLFCWWRFVCVHVRCYCMSFCIDFMCVLVSQWYLTCVYHIAFCQCMYAYLSHSIPRFLAIEEPIYAYVHGCENHAPQLDIIFLSVQVCHVAFMPTTRFMLLLWLPVLAVSVTPVAHSHWPTCLRLISASFVLLCSCLCFCVYCVYCLCCLRCHMLSLTLVYSMPCPAIVLATP